jgi:hypothetical protein
MGKEERKEWNGAVWCGGSGRGPLIPNWKVDEGLEVFVEESTQK